MTIDETMIIDLSKLSAIDISAFAKTLSENNKALIQRINETAKAYLLQEEVPGHEPTFAADPDFQTKWCSRWYIALRNRMCQTSSKGSAINLIFPVAVYLYECYELSPSQLILGCKTRTTLPLWLRQWAEQVSLLAPSELNRLYDILAAGTTPRHDTVFTLKQRICEMAAERGIPAKDFILYPGFLNGDLSVLTDFAATSFQETGNAYTVMKPFLGNHKMLRLLICLCAIYDVSPEYLLLQDYSSFIAIDPQWRYPLMMRQLISLLLSVDSATRSQAIAFVLSHTVACVEDGTYHLPEQKQPVNKESDFINVTETLALAGKREKAKVEAQLVESLKPKLLEILTLSGEPVSSAKLYSIVNGHSRLARRALLALEKEGRVEMIPKPRSAAFWKIRTTKQKKS